MNLLLNLLQQINRMFWIFYKADNKTRSVIFNFPIMQAITVRYKNPFEVGRGSHFETERGLEFLQLCSTLEL